MHKSKTIHTDIVIVGAGLSGLYTAYNLHKHNPKYNITLLEASDRIGGRIHTITTPDGIQYEAGAARFSPQYHRRLCDLMRELKLYKSIVPISNDVVPFGVKPSDIVDVNKIISSLNTTKLTRSSPKTLLDLIKDQHGPDIAKLVEKNYQYYAEIGLLHWYDAIKLFKGQFSAKTKYYILGGKGGLSQLTHKLHIRLKSFSNIKIHTSTRVESRTGNTLKCIGGMQITAHQHIIYCCPTDAITIFDPLLGNRMSKYIDTQPLYRIYAKYPLSKPSTIKSAKTTSIISKSSSGRSRILSKSSNSNNNSNNNSFSSSGSNSYSNSESNTRSNNLNNSIASKYIVETGKFNSGKTINSDSSNNNSSASASASSSFNIYKPKYNAQQVWFDAFTNGNKLSCPIPVSSPLKYIIPIDSTKGVIMISYTDSKNAKLMYNALDLGTNNNKLETLIKKLDNKNILISDRIPKAIWIKHHYWSSGMGLWKPGTNSTNVINSLTCGIKITKVTKSTAIAIDDIKNILIPSGIATRQRMAKHNIGSPMLWIAGENVSHHQGWMEGALESADIVIKNILNGKTNMGKRNVGKKGTKKKRQYGSGKTKKQRIISKTELAKHNTKTSAWICINKNVYDVTSWISQHPGGDIIMKGVGRDASAIFKAIRGGDGHPDFVSKNILPRYLIGKLK